MRETQLIHWTPNQVKFCTKIVFLSPNELTMENKRKLLIILQKWWLCNTIELRPIKGVKQRKSAQLLRPRQTRNFTQMEKNRIGFPLRHSECHCLPNWIKKRFLWFGYLCPIRVVLHALLGIPERLLIFSCLFVHQRSVWKNGRFKISFIWWSITKCKWIVSDR